MDRAKGTASTAAEEGKHVGGVAKQEAQHVVGTAAEQARNVATDTVQQVRDQLTEQTAGQRDRLVDTLRTFGDDLERMAGQAPGGGMAVDLAREAAQRARSLTDHLDGREPGQLLDDVRSFARRRPGTFLIGALAAGVVAGRLLRGAADGAAAAELATPEPSTGLGTGTGTAPGTGTGLASGTGALDAPLPASPAHTSGSAGVPPVQPGPSLTPSTHGQPTIEAP